MLFVIICSVKVKLRLFFAGDAYTHIHYCGTDDGWYHNCFSQTCIKAFTEIITRGRAITECDYHSGEIPIIRMIFTASS